MCVCVYVIRSLSLCVSTMSAVSVTEKEEKREREREKRRKVKFLIHSSHLSLSLVLALVSAVSPPSSRTSIAVFSTTHNPHTETRRRAREKKIERIPKRKLTETHLAFDSLSFVFLSLCLSYCAIPCEILKARDDERGGKRYT